MKKVAKGDNKGGEQIVNAEVSERQEINMFMYVIARVCV